MAYTNVTLKKKVNGVSTELYPKSSLDTVIDTKTGEKLRKIIDTLTENIGKTATSEEFEALKNEFGKLVDDAPEKYNSLKAIASAFTEHIDEYNDLVEEVGDKVGIEEGKSLIADELIKKIDELYSKDDMDDKFKTITEDIDHLTKLEYQDIDDENAVIIIN